MWNKLGPDAAKQKKSEIVCVKNLKVAICTLSIQRIFKIDFITTVNINITLIKNIVAYNRKYFVFILIHWK